MLSKHRGYFCRHMQQIAQILGVYVLSILSYVKLHLMQPNLSLEIMTITETFNNDFIKTLDFLELNGFHFWNQHAKITRKIYHKYQTGKTRFPHVIIRIMFKCNCSCLTKSMYDILGYINIWFIITLNNSRNLINYTFRSTPRKYKELTV